MRNIRTRRRVGAILAALLLASSALFAEARVASLIPQLKSFAESKVEEIFGNRFNISIGSVEGGLFHPLILKDCKIRDKDKNSILPSLNIISIRSDYRIWDVVAHGRWRDPMSGIASGLSSICINFATRHREVTGVVKIDGSVERADIKGHMELFGEERIDFSGKVDGSNFNVDIFTANGILKTSGGISDDGTLSIDVAANHFKIGELDIVCNVVSKNKIIKAEDGNACLEGSVGIRDIILNYSPIPELDASYSVSGSIVTIKDLKTDNGLRASGNISFKKPYDTDVTVMADNTNVTQLLKYMGMKDPHAVLSGTMNGCFKLKGPLEKGRLSLKFDIRRGTISTLDFDRLTATLGGDWPVINIEESRITRSSGYFVLGGFIDFKKAGKGTLFDNIRMVTSDSAVLWDGVDISKSHNVSEVLMTKKMSEEVSIGFKKFMAENTVDESLRNKDAVELEYKLHPNESIKMMLGQNKDFIGLEHKDKF